MIGTICFFIFCFLTLRSTILVIAEKKSAWLKLLDLLYVLIFGTLSLLLWLYAPPVFETRSLAISGILIVTGFVFLLRRLHQSYRSRPAIFLVKSIFAAFLIFFGTLVLMTAGFLSLFDDQPVLKISMSGKFRMQNVEWKSPNGRLQSQALPAYEVILEQPDKRPFARVDVYGDQVAIKARVMRLRPFLNLLGIRNFCRIDYIYNGYSTVDRFNAYPHLAQPLPSKYPALRPFQERFWQFWEREYYQEKHFILLKSATMESTYFPLVKPDGTPFRGAYYLTVNPGGLSSTPAQF